MKNNIFIPKTIRVGCQERQDTYTKRLAYVIYYDEKGKLRKETSWEGWRDKKIEPDDFDNTPTSGFVLNKKVGDYSDGWNHRHSYCRVYDPRGFEFEITVENLLYILENANSIKGKGLEGEFVYSWDGTDLVLLPVESPDYKEIAKYNETRHNPEKISTKELILGATYLHKNNNPVVYMGRYDRFEDSKWKRKDNYGKNIGKHYYFYSNGVFSMTKSISGYIVKVIDYNPVENYAELMDKLETEKFFSPFDISKTERVDTTFEQLIHFENKKYYYSWKYVSLEFEDGEVIFSQLNKENIGENKNGEYSLTNPNFTIYNAERMKFITPFKPQSTWNRDYHFTEKQLMDLYQKYNMKNIRLFLANGKEIKNV